MTPRILTVSRGHCTPCLHFGVSHGTLADSYRKCCVSAVLFVGGINRKPHSRFHLSKAFFFFLTTAQPTTYVMASRRGFRSTPPLEMNPNIASEGSFDQLFPLSFWTESDGQRPAVFPPTTMTGPDEYSGQSPFFGRFPIVAGVGIEIGRPGVTTEDPGLTLFTSVLNAGSTVHDTPVSSYNPLASDDTPLNLDGKPLRTSSRASRQISLKNKHAKVKEAKSNSSASSSFSTCGVQKSFSRRPSKASQRNKALKTEDEPDVSPLDFGSDLTQPTGNNIVQGSSSDGSKGPPKELPGQYFTGTDEDGRRIYQCPTCPKIRTRNLGDMRRHLDSLCHQDPGYRCVPKCSKAFTRLDALVRHIRTVHKDEENKIAVNDQKEAFFQVKETRDRA